MGWRMGEQSHNKQCLIFGSFRLPLTRACSSRLALPTHRFPPAPTQTAPPESSHTLLLLQSWQLSQTPAHPHLPWSLSRTQGCGHS